MRYGVQHAVPCNALTSALRLVAASLKICYEMCQTSTVQGFVQCRSSVTQAARSPDLSPLDYCVWGWMKKLVYSVKVVTGDELLSCILDAADRIRNSLRKLRRATSAVHNRAAACVAAGAGIFENQL